MIEHTTLTSPATAGPIPSTATGSDSAGQAQTVPISLDQLQVFTALQVRVAQLEAEQRKREDEAKAEQVKMLATKGEIEKALQTQRDQAEQQIATERNKLAALEAQARRYALDGELSKALAGQPLVPGGAEQLTRLWRDQFVVEPKGESFEVRTQAFESVPAFVAAQLSRAEYAHFVRPQNPGGGTAGTTGAHQVPPTPSNSSQSQSQPRNLGEAAILQVKSIGERAQADPRLNMSTGFGLRRSS
jgi:hypothetical protein